MSDWKSRAGASAAGGLGESAAEQAAREERHQVLIELLGAYADGELPPETTSQIDAHLVGCVRCRRDLAMHQTVRRRLGVEPPLAAPPALRERIAAAVAATPVAVERPSTSRSHPPRAHPFASRRVAAAVVAIVTIATAVWIGVNRGDPVDAPALGRLAASPTSVPLIRGVLADYRRVTAGDLPGRARDLEVVRAAVPFPVEPLHASRLRLLAAWTTDIDGEPAAVLAYRWDDRIVLQYLVEETRFFQHRAVRQAVTDGRLLVASEGGQGIVAWPAEAAGSLLVGDLEPERLVGLAMTGLLVRRVRGVAQ
jgi:anti-sigma factor RsiW